MKIITYKGNNFVIERGNYQSNGSCALYLKDETGQMSYTLSTYVPGVELARDEMILKDYNENHDIANFFLKKGLLKDTGRTAECGFMDVPIVKILCG